MKHSVNSCLCEDIWGKIFLHGRKKRHWTLDANQIVGTCMPAGQRRGPVGCVVSGTSCAAQPRICVFFEKIVNARCWSFYKPSLKSEKCILFFLRTSNAVWARTVLVGDRFRGIGRTGPWEAEEVGLERHEIQELVRDVDVRHVAARGTTNVNARKTLRNL